MGRRHSAGTAFGAALAVVLAGACGPRTLTPTTPENDAAPDTPGDTAPYAQGDAAPDAHADVAAPGTDVGQEPVLEDDGGLRTKSGVPVGDCVEPTAAAGCPQTEPEQESPCDGHVGLRCPYPIMTSDGYASQDVVTCSRSDFSTPPGAIVWFGTRNICGRTCDLPPANTIALPTADCQSRAVVKCQLDLEGAGWSFSADNSAQNFLDDELAAVVTACAKRQLTDQLIEVLVTNGCPTSLLAAVDASVLACLKARLATVLWDCAIPLTCAQYDIVLI
jgi:hypothetical protein